LKPNEHKTAQKTKNLVLNPILHMRITDNCFTCGQFLNHADFLFAFQNRDGNLTILEFSSKWVKAMLPYKVGGAACSEGLGAV
jgi:hypothetical protein